MDWAYSSHRDDKTHEEKALSRRLADTNNQRTNRQPRSNNAVPPVTSADCPLQAQPREAGIDRHVPGVPQRLPPWQRSADYR